MKSIHYAILCGNAGLSRPRQRCKSVYIALFKKKKNRKMNKMPKTIELDQ